MDFDILFASSIFAPVLIILGLFGNIFGILISKRKKLIKFGPRTILIYLFIFDFIYFPLIIKPYLQYSFNIDITIISSLTCKVHWYANYAFATISPMLNVYISIERFISINYQSRRFFLRKKQTQNAYILGIVVFNMLIYSPIGK
jgi:hypothetical protein